MHSQSILVFEAPRKRACSERALVLQAMGLPYAITGDGNGWHLWVPEVHAGVALAELRSYEEENRFMRNRPAPPPSFPVALAPLFAYLIVLSLFYAVGRDGLFGINFYRAGLMDSGLVLKGEIWRLATALTLHGDIGHLAANLFFGGLFVALLTQSLGSGLAWAGTLVSGVLGNLVTTWISGDGHRAIGASTAVFGTLGLFTVYEWVRRRKLRLTLAPSQRFRAIAPLLGGSVLLGFLGTGGGGAGERVDVLSHLTGFCCGAALGALAAWRSWPVGITPAVQRRAQIGVLVVLAVAWIAAAWAA
ncbi:MAG: rhomboid family intramembrane serine protease [Planctomycetota bacterium]